MTDAPLSPCAAPSTPRPSSRSPARAPSRGDRLGGRYVLLDLLGEGGMGSVWRARCLRLGVDVAIKLLRGAALQPDAAERLRREAKAAARVCHPATVRVIDLGATPAGDPFLVMELLAGQSLAAILRARGRLPEREAVRLLLPIASGLSAAHEQGVIHRDVKPANIVIVPMDEEGCCQPKLVDFGVAKDLADSAAAPSEVGLTLGSVGYMAPEQLRADPDINAAVDVWGLSVVLYELVTGVLPFEGTKPMSYLSAVFRCAPRPTTEVIVGDAALWAILARGLSRSRADRWPTMAAFGAALARWAMEQGETTDARGVPLERFHALELTEKERWHVPRSPPAAMPLPALAPPLRALWDLAGELRFL